MPTRNFSVTTEQRLQALRTQLEAGVAALEAGDVDEIAEEQLESYLAALTPPRRRRPR